MTEEDAEDLDVLIAATVAGAAPEDHVEEPPAERIDPEPTVSEEAPEAPPYSESEDAAAEAAGVSGQQVESDTAAVEEAEAASTAPARFDELPPSSEEDLAGAIDLGDISSPEVRDRLLAQALAHAEMQDARYRVPFSDPRRAGRWKGAAAAVLFLVAGVFALAPPHGCVPILRPKSTPPDR